MKSVNRSAEVALTGRSEQEMLASLNECTTGLASSAATPDGRPLLWKNRDVGMRGQEFHYVDDGRIPFISITYTGDLKNYYGGVNAAGFAVENSNSYNLPNGPGENGWGFGDDDGKIHYLALATCHTIDDFQAILDSLNEHGRTLNCNYGAIDAYGGAAMFETAGYTYVRCDAADSPEGFLIRSNYSYSGDGLANQIRSWGGFRHDRAYKLWKAAVESNTLTPQYIAQKVVRDLAIEGTDPYPLPFDGYVNSQPYGAIPNDEAICRYTTRGIMIAKGVSAGERPDDAMLWALVGSQLATVAIPLWVRAGSVPVEADGQLTSRLCDRDIQLSDWIYGPDRVVDTWKLVNPSGSGLWDWMFPLEDWVFAKTDAFLKSPGFSYDRLEAFQNAIAAQVADSMDAWRPAFDNNEIMQPVYANGQITIAWVDQTGKGGKGRDVRGYKVYRSTEPFREGNWGSMIAEVSDPTYSDADPPIGGAFYRIETEY